MLSVILVEPEHASNVGAVARAMANFGFDKLILLNPKCDHKSNDAILYGKHAARKILEKATVIKSWNEIPCSTLVATTAKTGTDYNISRSPVSPKQLAELLPKKANAGIVFGREGTGLLNNELAKCDFVVTIPSSKTYGTLNLSHAVAVVLYEIFQTASTETTTSHIVFATDAEKKQLRTMLEQALKKMQFVSEQKRNTQRMVWKRMLAKSFLSKREAYALMGFFRKILDTKY